MSRKALIAANWKMYKTPGEAKAFVDAFLPLVALAVGYWGQRVLQSVLRQGFDSAPMSIYRHRPRWSRVGSYPPDSAS